MKRSERSIAWDLTRIICLFIAIYILKYHADKVAQQFINAFTV